MRRFDRGASQRIPSGIEAVASIEIRIYGCNLNLTHFHGLRAWQTGATIYDNSSMYPKFSASANPDNIKQQVNIAMVAKFDGIQASPVKLLLACGVATLLSPGSTTAVSNVIDHEAEKPERLNYLTGNGEGVDVPRCDLIWHKLSSC